MKIRQHDRLPALQAKVFTEVGAVDLTVFTAIAFKMVGPATINGVATGDAQGNLSYAWGETDTAVPGHYKAVFTGTDVSGRKQTFPTTTDLEVEVIAAI